MGKGSGFLTVGGLGRGCGKSTLLSILGLLDTPTDGRYSLNQRPLADLGQADRARTRYREIGFTFTVYENVEFPLT